MRELEEKCPHKPDHQKRCRKGCVKVADWRQRQGGVTEMRGHVLESKMDPHRTELGPIINPCKQSPMGPTRDYPNGPCM
ncbi:hypothetical protein DNTS_027369, partial [Danionella cerebrum]